MEGIQWDQLLASLLQKPKPSDSKRECVAPLRFQPTPSRRHWLNLPREVSLIKPNLRDAIRECSQAKSPWPLVAIGRPGTGKTSAAMLMVDHVPKSEIWTATEFHSKVIRVKLGNETWTNAGGNSGTWTEPKFWEWISSLDLVALDDVGLRDRATAPMYENLVALLDRRSHRPLVVTSNLGLRQLADVFDARVADRLAAGTVIELTGESMR